MKWTVVGEFVFAAAGMGAYSGPFDGLLELRSGRNDAGEVGSVQLPCRLERLSVVLADEPALVLEVAE